MAPATVVKEPKPTDKQKQAKSTGPRTSSSLGRHSRHSNYSGSCSIPYHSFQKLPTVQQTPFVNKFKADLSDKVKIPNRGTSASSYGKDQKIHTELLEELDNLFPASQQKNSQVTPKLRASTVSIGRIVALHQSLSKPSQGLSDLSDHVNSDL